MPEDDVVAVMRTYVPCVPFCCGSAPATRTELQHPGGGGGAREGGEGEGGGGGAREGGEGEGGGGNIPQRGPQSVQSTPIKQMLHSDPGPPSLHSPSDAAL